MLRTALYERHRALGARLVEFGGWEMPLQYPTGIVEEHLATRREAGLFDVSHMGRFRLRGGGALALLQHALTGNAAALTPGQAQYTMIPDEGGGARDDAYLYCLGQADYLLVVNAANREADWEYLRTLLGYFPEAQLAEATQELAMLSLQGPGCRRILLEVAGAEALPEPGRNNLLVIGPRRLGALAPGCVVARTGCTGEALGFELFVPAAEAASLWDRLAAAGATPVGLAPGTPCAWRRPSLCMGTSWAWIRRGSRSPSFPARWPGSPSPSARSKGRSSAGRPWPGSRSPISGPCAGIGAVWRICPDERAPWSCRSGGWPARAAPWNGTANRRAG